MKPSDFAPTKILASGFALFLCVLSDAHPAPGDLDLSFDLGSGIDGAVHAVAIQADGKLIIGGEFTTVKGLVRANIARLNVDGSSDSNFVAADYASAGGVVYALAIQPDGKVLVGHRYGIARLEANGILDPSFNASLISEYYPATVHSIALQPDGRLLVGGAFVTTNGANTHFGIARLESNGPLDSTFQGRTTFYTTVHALALQPDGKVLVGAEAGSQPSQSLSRLNADGTVDASFRLGNDVNASVYCVATDPEGKVLIGGNFTGVNGTSRSRIARFNSDGTLDVTFDPGLGAAGSIYTAINSLVPLANGKVLIGGFFSTVDGTNRNRIARLNRDGTLDGSFNPGTAADSDVESVVVQPDGKVLIGGYFSSVSGTNRNRVARLNADGSVDSSFQPSTGINGPVSSLLVGPEGETVIHGGFSLANDLARNQIARLNPDATVDDSFNPDIGKNGAIHCVALQEDGQVLIGMGLPPVAGVPGYKVARFNRDGTLDGTFHSLVGSHASVSSIVPQVDGKVLVVINSTFTEIVRLNADGSLDGSFNSSPAIEGYGAARIASQPDGKIVIGANTGQLIAGDSETGDYYVYSYALRRLNSDGSLDTTFQHVTGGYSFDPSPQLRTIALQPDGKVLIAGEFHAPTGSGVARLKSDGTWDGSFSAVTGPVDAVLVQPDGKILIGGSFTSVGGVARNRMARLNANGRLDKLFDPGAGPNETVRSIAAQSAEKVLIGGAFTTVDGEIRGPIARLDASDGPPNAVPNVSITPVGATNFVVPGTIPIMIDASDRDGSIAQVDVYADETLIGSDTIAPFEVAWANPASGDYAITAYATDDLGATGTSLTLSVSVTAPPPAAPSNLTAKPVSAAKIKLGWIDNSNDELGFIIEQSINGKPFTEIAILSENVTSFTSAGLSPRKRYTYRVRAYNASGDSTYSNTTKPKTLSRFNASSNST